MEGIYGDFMEFMKRPVVVETLVDILLCAVPIWVAVMIGLVIGWSWRPRWTGLVFLGLRSKFRFIWTAPPGFGARRLWLAFTALSAFSVGRKLWSNFKGKGEESAVSESSPLAPAQSVERSSSGVDLSSMSSDVEQDIVTEKDLEHLLYLLERRAEDTTAWQSMMERSTTNMAYQAWRHEPETGPTIYCSKTVFEDATPELVRDFFWDDEFRPKWDPMLAYCKVLEECPHKGTMIVHWVKKFPFFCSDREYIIGRRIWESGKTYYCVTKGVPYPGLQKRDKPRRVDLYFSSWIIKTVESRKGDGQLSACEVILVHYEDMGIPKDVAKLGVRHGMWGAVKKLHSGMRAYQLARKSGSSLSRCAQMAQITTTIPVNDSTNSLDPVSVEEERGQTVNLQQRKVDHGFDWKWVFIGGTVAVVCGLQTGIIGRALLLGAARRVAQK
ncbi:PREDICTED: stAR-related lipid transfer protein 7, mitochondrial-like [Nelumbo nucifera]|uniref:StAR-related lipid transfer protein 7, mitochondrial-like n=1 Tax=Nelumbo nucifera TaxID=4432 RepID=A0A1U8B482_NELNU|nr:PREDICTED: stAR-related lipid transfer protein 7, mitochondrial-like [Nelumbo nucifera]